MLSQIIEDYSTLSNEDLLNRFAVRIVDFSGVLKEDFKYGVSPSERQAREEAWFASLKSEILVRMRKGELVRSVGA